MSRRRTVALLSVLLSVTWASPGSASDPDTGRRYITVASTTSTHNSGLFGHILPLFTAQSGIEVRVVALGTGQALDVGRRGDADVVFVHDTAAEMRFVAEGHGVGRRKVMYNDFVLVGPSADPARVAGSQDIAAALRSILSAQTPFVSRGDRSGTHAAELRLWDAAGIDISTRKGTWYRETGAGMGATLNIAAAMDAYALSDRGTWLSFANRRNHGIIVEGDPTLFNQYGVTLVNPARHPYVKESDARVFIGWLVSPEGQATIASFRVNGEQAFFPNADRAGGQDRD